jgi:hypothetical protein
MQPTPEDLAADTQPRTGLRRATATGAAVAGLVAGGLGAAPSPAGAAPTAPTGATAPATAAVDCTNPPDACTVETAPLANDTGGAFGTVVLRCSPTCRVVRSVVAINQNSPVCSLGDNVKAWITSWVNDAGVRQAAKGQRWFGSTVVGAGQTDPF